MKRRTWTKLDQPLRARKPATWVMPDVFTYRLGVRDVDKHFAIVAACASHQFEIHTPLVDDLHWYLAQEQQVRAYAIFDLANSILRQRGKRPINVRWTLPNLTLWSTIRDQSDADRIVPQLLGCPAAVRGVRAVLRGPVDLTSMELPDDPLSTPDNPAVLNAFSAECHHPQTVIYKPDGKCTESGIHRLRISGETGRDAAPCNVQWIRSLAEQAERAGMVPGVDVVVERLGSHIVTQCASTADGWPDGTRISLPLADERIVRLRARTGSDPAEWPDDLRRFAEKEDGNG